MLFQKEDKINAFSWTEKDQIDTERHTMEEYRKNVQRLQGYKYALWIAKEYPCDHSNNGSKQSEGKVIGVVEVGLTQGPLENQKRPTIGVLCIDPTYQRLGVGSALIETCESLIVQVWNDSWVYVQIEPWNIKALKFFQKRGYQLVQNQRTFQKDASSHIERTRHDENKHISFEGNDSNSILNQLHPLDFIMVRLYRNRVLQDVPHVLMIKALS